jgi:cold shock CspA family protein
MVRERGTVLSWNAAEGHGRIRANNGEVLWAHFGFIVQERGFRELLAGQRVEFTRVDAPGPPEETPHARDIVVLPTEV